MFDLLGNGAASGELAARDPLAWLEKYREGIVKDIEHNKYEFTHAQITFGDGQILKMAFCGDSYNDPYGADGHRIYVDNEKLLGRIAGLTYDEAKNAWAVAPEIAEEEERVYLSKDGDGSYALNDVESYEDDSEDSEAPGFNAQIDADVAKQMFEILIEKQKVLGNLVSVMRPLGRVKADSGGKV